MKFWNSEICFSRAPGLQRCICSLSLCYLALEIGGLTSPCFPGFELNIDMKRVSGEDRQWSRYTEQVPGAPPGGGLEAPGREPHLCLQRAAPPPAPPSWELSRSGHEGPGRETTTESPGQAKRSRDGRHCVHPLVTRVK